MGGPPVHPKIIIGLDPERGGDDALSLGRRLAPSLGAAIEVVTVLPWPSHLAGHDDLQREVDAELEDRFATFATNSTGSRWRHAASRTTRPRRFCRRSPRTSGASLIVLASSHRGPLGRTLLGSVGESLTHGAPCAVAIAPRGYAQHDDAALDRSRSPTTNPRRPRWR